MKFIRSVSNLLVLSMVVLGSGCLKTRADVDSQEQTKAMNQKQAENQKQQVEQKSEPDPNELMRQLIGRVEVLETGLAQIKADQAKQTTTNPADAQKLQTLQDAVLKLEAQMQKIEAEKQAVAMAAAAKAQAEEETQKNSKFSPYQIGEVHFGKKEWKKAILSYQKYSEDFPKGKFVADSKYKIGVSFQELGLKDEAIAFYEEVVSQFPATETGKKAKYRLSQLKKK